MAWKTFEIFPAIKMLLFDIKNNVLAKMNLLPIQKTKIKSQIREGANLKENIL